MKIAVLSGKGGTGKTLLSVNLAASSSRSMYVDCDVEEPNGYLFFKPSNIKEEDISVLIPVVDESLCSGCRKCVEFCSFNALAFIGGKVKVFDEICHSCGGCALLCPENAISEIEKNIGKVQRGKSEDVLVKTGIMNTGEASGIPIIKSLLEFNKDELGRHIFIDCPPGSACIVMESIKDADYCVIVAEPTLFGVHNMAMVYELVKLFDKPFGAVLNKCVDGEKNPAEEFCLEKGIKILGKIPFDESLGKLNSDGEIVARKNLKHKAVFSSLLNSIIKDVPK